jgi:hypothetical protein
MDAGGLQSRLDRELRLAIGLGGDGVSSPAGASLGLRSFKALGILSNPGDRGDNGK